VRELLTATLLVALGSMPGGCGGGCTDDDPSGLCDPPLAVQGLTELDLVQRDGDDIYHSIADQDVLPLVRGPQGAGMVLVHLQVRGASVPDCLAQRTEARDASGLLADAHFRGVATHELPDGSSVTDELQLIVDHLISTGDVMVLEATVSGTMTRRVVYLDEAGTLPAPDGGPGGFDAAAGDAG
jgi:hypothetical protein